MGKLFSTKQEDSTMIYDRYAEWTEQVQDKSLLYHWFLGERIGRKDNYWRSCFDDHSFVYAGVSGSGMTEAMKHGLTMFICKHPNTHLIICDLKKTWEWDVYAPITESGAIIKSEDETLKAISYTGSVLQERIAYMASRGYRNIKEWGESENIAVPPVVLLLNEFPQLNAGCLNFEQDRVKEGTPANALYQLYTKGRSAGIWVCLGSQYTGENAIPEAIMQQIKAKVILRVGTPDESRNWLNSDCAFLLGKTKKREDGERDNQAGYGYVNSENTHVRFWMVEDWYITHEFYKYRVLPLKGKSLKKFDSPKSPIDIRERIRHLQHSGKSENNLSTFDKARLRNHKAAVKKFSKSLARHIVSYESFFANAPFPTYKEPLGTLWKSTETVDEYTERLREGFKTTSGRTSG